ncbi:hypothetical protein [Natrialba sp. INN-245]|uniref:DUF7344 domain-containing protein n=1 Tax=Natrialba sp. INN-245 TaxID=2690967 RepID=UPI0013136EF9|nr:hypothetical protein [Natrialba sp. INN-245]MWV41059.1 hypothetical protein [Natrialba sp. INN-245]
MRTMDSGNAGDKDASIDEFSESISCIPHLPVPNNHWHTRDTYLDLINNRRRRLVIRILSNEKKIFFEDLVDRMMEINDAAPKKSDSLRNGISVALEQAHLPTLEEAGIVEYDSDESIISIRPEAGRVTWILKCIDEVMNTGCSEDQPEIAVIESTPPADTAIGYQDDAACGESDSGPDPVDETRVWKEGYKEGFADGFAQKNDE